MRSNVLVFTFIAAALASPAPVPQVDTSTVVPPVETSTTMEVPATSTVAGITSVAVLGRQVGLEEKILDQSAPPPTLTSPATTRYTIS